MFLFSTNAALMLRKHYRIHTYSDDADLNYFGSLQRRAFR